MFGFPEDLDLTPLVGATLDTVAFAAFTIHLSFDGGHRITIEGCVGYRAGDDDEERWDVVPPASSGLMRLTGQTVTSWQRIDRERVELDFDGGGHLVLVDDQPNYEAVQLLIDGVETIV